MEYFARRPGFPAFHVFLLRNLAIFETRGGLARHVILTGHLHRHWEMDVTMPTRKRTDTKRKSTRGTKSSASDRASVKDLTVYSGFEIWTSKKSPAWHPIKKMRYVFFRMIHGVTITDAIREIHWNVADFWHLIDHDTKSHDPFRLEYNRAKKLQARAMADSVITIAEGRDPITRKSVKNMQKIIERGLKRLKREKSPIAVKTMVESLKVQMDLNESKILGRNKLQIESAKWLAKNLHPMEFGESSKIALGGTLPDGSDGSRNTTSAIMIQFVGPDGKVVAP